jgi:hypothetical protein
VHYSGGSDTAQADAKKAPDATVRDAAAANEATAATTAKEVIGAVAAKEVVAAVKRAPDATVDPKVVAEKTAAMAESSGVGSGGSGAAQVDATLDLKEAAKRFTAMMESGGSSPPCKRFCGTWRYTIYF